MVLGFRRRSSAKAPPPPSPIRASPSLPQLNSQGIPWPEILVDMASIRQAPPNERPRQGAVKTSLTSSEGAPIPFHKPFRDSPGQSPNGKAGGISSLYMAPSPPSAFTNFKNGLMSRKTKPVQRKPRMPPTFNLMVCGGQGTGKTSLLRLLLDTADISPSATNDQRVALDRFLRGKPKRTQTIQTACVEICESRFDRILLSVVDTPGLDFREGRELKLDRQVTGIVKYIDTQYADTMNEESKVERQGKGDAHIHLCIYMVDPSSVIEASARRAQSSLPTRTRSETTITYHPQDLASASDDDSEDEDDKVEKLTMSPAELRVIRRLSTRVNVLPVVAFADSLTDEKLLAVKKAIRRDLREAGLNFGVFGEAMDDGETSDKEDGPIKRRHDAPKENGKGEGHITPKESDDEDEGYGHEDEEVGERRSRSVIKLRAARSPKPRRSHSRSRLEMTDDETDREPLSPDMTDKESIARVRFSAHVVANTDLTALMPFAVIAPEHVSRHRRALHASRSEHDHSVAASEDGRSVSVCDSLASPTIGSSMSVRMPYLDGPPEDLKGVFTRRFRWGTVDVLNPEHCDFAALRTAVLSTHIKVLKIHTREVLYEKYRTEKLLARRATRNITEGQTKRLFQDLGL